MSNTAERQVKQHRVFFARLVSGVMLTGVLACGMGQSRAIPQTTPVPQHLTLIATDVPITERKIVPALTSGNKFTDLLIPTAVPITRQGKRLPLAAIKPGHSLVCRGSWTDATRSTFRAVSVTVGGAVPPGVLRERVARACELLTGRTRPSQNTTTPVRTTPVASPRVVSALDGFVMENAKLTRDEEASREKGTDNSPYCVEGTLRNISGQAYDRLEIQVSVLDRDGKKIADQNAIALNVRPGDRLKFRATPPVYLSYRLGQTIRIEKITGTLRAE
jgi:hypothetical protein